MNGHGRNACFSIVVVVADAWWREWSGVVPGLRPPRDEEWGARTFGLNDPAGNTIFVIGPPREATP